MRPTLFFALIFALPSFAQTPKVDFAHDVAPLLKTHCGKCHTNGSYKGGLSMDTRPEMLKAKAFVPGKSAESEMILRVLSKDAEYRMPPEGDRLTDAQVAILKKWIDAGAPWEEGFSFKPNAYAAPLKPRRVTLPPGDGHPIDRLLAAAKVPALTPADDNAFIRRAYLDLIGQLPTWEEVSAFTGDQAVDKREVLVRRLLAEKRSYADHWLSFWNDLLRNDYSGTGFIDKGRTQISAWLYKSLNDNTPYDVFTRELLAPTAASEGFANGIQWRGNVNASQVRELQYAQNIGQVFFGANLKCASCHDSFIDSWKLDDAYGLAAVIAEKPLEIHRCDKPTGKMASAKFPWPELGAIDPKLSKPERMKRVAELATHPDNGRFTRTIANRVWHRLMGHGIVHPVDLMGTKPWSEDLLDYLAVYLAENGCDLKKLMEHIATSKAYQARTAPDAPPGEAYAFRGPLPKRLTAEQFLDALWQLGGQPKIKMEAPVAVPGFDETVAMERRFVRASLMKSNPFLRALGRPNREQVVTVRPEEMGTLEALELANGSYLSDTLARCAVKWKGASAEDIYRAFLGREPNAEEKRTAEAILGDATMPERVADLLWILAMLPEFQLVR